MIIDSPSDHYWVYIVPSEEKPLELSEEEYLEHYGKWLMFGPRVYMEKLAGLIDPLVENGQIDRAKYCKKEPGFDSFPNRKDYVMCVYSDNRKRNEVKQLLEKLGVKSMTWKYDRRTFEDWKPGGKLFEESRRELEQ